MCINCNLNMPEIENGLSSGMENEEPKCLCPNCTAQSVFEGKLPVTKGKYVSDLSGEEGALMVNSRGDSDITFCVTYDEALRLFGHGLMPDEYRKFAEKYSPREFLIHDDFYDEATGLAIQPMDEEAYAEGLKEYMKTHDVSDEDREVYEEALEEFGYPLDEKDAGEADHER